MTPGLRALAGGAVALTLVGGGLLLAEDPADDRTVLTVLAAASLGPALEDAAASFESDHPDVDVVVGLGQSSGLAAQVLAGAPADVLATADDRTMARALAGKPDAEAVTLATNGLALAVGAGADVASLADLADASFAVCRPEVPCGDLAARALAGAGLDAEPVTYEPDVTAVLTKVAWGEVDAGLVYASDVRPEADAVREGRVRTVPLPAAARLTTDLPVVALPDAPHPALARAFVAHLLSPAGRAALTGAGLGAP